MELKKLQMSINPIKSPEAYQLVKRWEKEGAGEKGYENKKIQEVLAAWANLMELYGVTDIMKLAMLLARDVPTPNSSFQHYLVQQQEKGMESVPSTIDTVGEVPDPYEQDYLALLASAQAKTQK